MRRQEVAQRNQRRSSAPPGAPLGFQSALECATRSSVSPLRSARPLCRRRHARRGCRLGGRFRSEVQRSASRLSRGEDDEPLEVAFMKAVLLRLGQQATVYGGLAVQNTAAKEKKTQKRKHNKTNEQHLTKNKTLFI